MEQGISANELRGKWVILRDKNIIAYGNDVKELIEEAKKEYPSDKLILAKVPEKGTLIY